MAPPHYVLLKYPRSVRNSDAFAHSLGRDPCGRSAAARFAPIRSCTRGQSLKLERVLRAERGHAHGLIEVQATRMLAGVARFTATTHTMKKVLIKKKSCARVEFLGATGIRDVCEGALNQVGLISKKARWVIYGRDV